MKSLRIAHFIFKLYLINWIICIVMYGTHWIYESQGESEATSRLISDVLLYSGFIIYFIPIFAIYEDAVKSHAARKKFGRHLMKIISDHSESAAEQEPGEPGLWSTKEKEWAESGQCDCERCTSIRESIKKEEKS